MTNDNLNRRNDLETRLQLYATPHHITAALLRREKFPGKMCEPCVGRGDIAIVLKEGGYRKVLCSDLYDWGYPGTVVQDFFQMRQTVGSIITNPPYRKCRDFVRQAKTLANKVAMLLPADFEASVQCDELRADKEFPLKAVYTFTQGIPWKNFGRAMGPGKHAWFVWERGWTGDTSREFITFASKTLDEIPPSNVATANDTPNSSSQPEFYRTPPEVTQALLDREEFDGTILDPVAGMGDMTKVLRAKYPKKVLASDLYDYGFKCETGVDFLKTTEPCDCIVMNPPFSKTAAFVRHAIQLARKKVAVLCPASLGTLSGTGKIFENSDFPLKKMYVFPKPIPWLNAPKAGRKYQIVWFVFERGHQGPAARESIDLASTNGKKTPSKRPAKTPTALVETETPEKMPPSNTSEGDAPSQLLFPYPGSKWNLAKKYADLYPPHTTFVDVFGGTGAAIASSHPPRSKSTTTLTGVCSTFSRSCRRRNFVANSSIVWSTPRTDGSSMRSAGRWFAILAMIRSRTHGHFWLPPR